MNSEILESAMRKHSISFLNCTLCLLNDIEDARVKHWKDLRGERIISLSSFVEYRRMEEIELKKRKREKRDDPRIFVAPFSCLHIPYSSEHKNLHLKSFSSIQAETINWAWKFYLHRTKGNYWLGKAAKFSFLNLIRNLLWIQLSAKFQLRLVWHFSDHFQSKAENLLATNNKGILSFHRWWDSQDNDDGSFWVSTYFSCFWFWLQKIREQKKFHLPSSTC